GEALARVTPRTRAILPVHLFGLPADLDRLRAGFGGAIVEDAAQAFGAAWQGKKVGTMGDLAAFSFFPTKNLGGLGDGGMVTTDHLPWADSVRRLRVHGAVEKYRHETVGINSRLDALQAAALSVKLRYLEEWNRRRQALAARYEAGFRAYALGEWVRWPTIPEGATHVFHQYTIRCQDRDALQRHLAAAGIGSTVYYPIPLHLQPALREFGAGEGSLPQSEQAARSVLSLPMFPELTEEEVDQVVEAVAAFYGKA
ncbi:MAG: DegT/DnrJ/EryC1/StrS family aminotransferase, partial [Firmicutes bacterium]|nr:DegT/DnrJ/EryC1/StrS family aminotransferase [Bacillota bacterium]